MGGSVGTSVLTTLLVRRQQVVQSNLVDHISVFDAWRLSNAAARLPGAHTFNLANQLMTGQKQGLAMLYGSVQAQATMISLNDIYKTLGGAAVISALLCFFLPRPLARAPPRARPTSRAHSPRLAPP